jgi:hypothetical protein
MSRKGNQKAEALSIVSPGIQRGCEAVLFRERERL